MRCIALVFVVAASGTAIANPPCQVAGPLLPSGDAYPTVPANAKLWVWGGGAQFSIDVDNERTALEPIRYSLLDTPLFETRPHLIPGREHVVRDASGAVLSRFMVSERGDYEAPTPPVF